MEATPRPWTLFRETYIVGADDDCIGATDGLDKGDAEAKANAAFIVKAANAHDLLVEALEAVEWRGFEDTHCPLCDVPAIVGIHEPKCLLGAALALARGEVE